MLSKLSKRSKPGGERSKPGGFKYGSPVRAALSAVLMFLVTLPVMGEDILNLSRLNKKLPEYTLKRDIFSPDPMRPRNTPPPPVVKPKVVEPTPEEIEARKKIEEQKNNVEDEIRRSLSFDGYIIKNSISFALVAVSGEFFTVTADDIVLERIKIVAITHKSITVEVDSNRFEIPIKEDDTNE